MFCGKDQQLAGSLQTEPWFIQRKPQFQTLPLAPFGLGGHPMYMVLDRLTFHTQPEFSVLLALAAVMELTGFRGFHI
jgi:hypothetical protein